MQAHGCDLIFRNARVVDGSGNPWYRADVGVTNGRIAAVAPGLDLPARRIVDAEGQILAPGFVDMHSHSDVTLLVEPRHEPRCSRASRSSCSGRTGCPTRRSSPVVLEQIRRHLAGLNGDDAGGRLGLDQRELVPRPLRPAASPSTWATWSRTTPSGSARWAGSGALPTPAELDRMRALVAEGMEDGAFGLLDRADLPAELGRTPTRWSPCARSWPRTAAST